MSFGKARHVPSAEPPRPWTRRTSYFTPAPRAQNPRPVNAAARYYADGFGLHPFAETRLIDWGFAAIRRAGSLSAERRRAVQAIVGHSLGIGEPPPAETICGPQGRALIHFVPSVAMAFLGRLEEARAGARAGLALNPHFTIARYRATLGDTGISACSPIPFAERRSVWTVAR